MCTQGNVFHWVSFPPERPDHLALGAWWQELWLLCLHSLPGLNLSVPIKSRRNKTWEWLGLCLCERGENSDCVCVCLGSLLVSVVAQFGIIIGCATTDWDYSRTSHVSHSLVALVLFSKHPPHPTPPPPLCNSALALTSFSSFDASLELKKTVRKSKTLRASPHLPRKCGVLVYLWLKITLGRGRSILSLQLEKQGGKEEVVEEEEKQAERTERSVRNLTTYRNVSVCVMRRSESFPWPYTVALALLPTAV